jgi:hypothetical protein
MSNAAKKSAPASITKAEVTSNVDTEKTANLVNGILRMTYYESILQDSVKANVIFGDVGLAVDNKSVIEGLPLIGTEDIKLEFEDNNENKIKVNMNVNKVTPVYEDGSKNVISLDLVSEEFLRNEMGESRCRTRENGLISDSVEKIFKDRLKTEKPLDIEQSANRYNFIGNGRKPFYMLNLLSKQGVPQNSDGSSAGFLFFETSTGYHFKSIEGLFKQEKKKSYIFNNSTDAQAIPAGYDGKVLEHQSDSAINVQSKMNMGAYKTKIVLFDAYNCKYEVIEQTAEEVKENVELAGKDLPKFNSKFDSQEKDYTRTTLYLVDSGTLPDGDTQKQIEASTKPNFEAVRTLNQSIRRYNQLFSGMMEITIAGDFSLHAGDVIFVDIFSVSAEKDDTLNRESGGLYIIADLCHFLDADATYTKLNLARDSFGRKGNHSKR